MFRAARGGHTSSYGVRPSIRIAKIIRLNLTESSHSWKDCYFNMWSWPYYTLLNLTVWTCAKWLLSFWGYGTTPKRCELITCETVHKTTSYLVNCLAWCVLTVFSVWFYNFWRSFATLTILWTILTQWCFANATPIGPFDRKLLFFVGLCVNGYHTLESCRYFLVHLWDSY